MASTPAATVDTPITLKINHDGISKRFKLPLRDLGAATLENKLRGLLTIPASTPLVFERYSDSAEAYVLLDPANNSVYKQLYRAAKAKQKLKFRITTPRAPVEKASKGPKPASVEDVVETDTVTVPKKPLISLSTTLDTQKGMTTQPTEVHHRAFEFLAQAQHKAQQSQASVERHIEKLEASMAALRIPALGQPSPPPAPVPAHALLPATSERAYAANTFAVYCNSCDKTIPDVHFHCSACDDGDFDLCQNCVDRNITCYGDDHWLIKRTVRNNTIINSTTERIAPKPKHLPPVAKFDIDGRMVEPCIDAKLRTATAVCHMRAVSPVKPVETLEMDTRTCNCCVQDFPEREFVHCQTCEDYDLCMTCFVKNQHGHHPRHGFAALAPAHLEPRARSLLAPGRGQVHKAVCDGCDVFITGVRHKCLDCPDFDYCNACVQYSESGHPGHRFVPLYEQVETTSEFFARFNATRPLHTGICCDGPLCKSKRGNQYITGVRYKCAVCHDTDFCANCEAAPGNTHNRTHPLIKFKTPVRSVSVHTSQEHGERPPTVLGDRRMACPALRSCSSRATETNRPASVATDVQTVVDVQPTPSVKVAEEKSSPAVNIEEELKPSVKAEEEQKPARVEAPQVADELLAVFLKDAVADGTVYPPNHLFEQTWVLRNEGNTSWPAGCSVKFVGGDYMGHTDPSHPAAISELTSSSESTICYGGLAPGQEFSFTVLLRTPNREGRVVSNWRLTTRDGLKFGHRLWCDVLVEKPKQISSAAPAANALSDVKPEAKDEEMGSQMIFPKLEKESPVASIHEDVAHEARPAYETEDEYEDCDEDGEWDEDADEDAFMTDEEYDILDASDEEYLQEQQKKLPRK